MTLGVDCEPHCERDNGVEDCEIEITPEMIEAGELALDEFCRGHGGYAPYVVKQVFRAMWRVCVSNRHLRHAEAYGMDEVKT